MFFTFISSEIDPCSRLLTKLIFSRQKSPYFIGTNLNTFHCILFGSKLILKTPWNTINRQLNSVYFIKGVFNCFKDLISLLTLKSIVIFIPDMDDELAALVFHTLGKAFYVEDFDASFYSILLNIIDILISHKERPLLLLSEPVEFAQNA